MMARDIPNGPWEEIANDFFTLNLKDYLVICNTFSTYPPSLRYPPKTAEATIPKFQQLFTQYGPARTLFTDNGKPFLSETFTAYMMQQQV